MRKGEKYEKKIDKKTLIKLRKDNKTIKEIAEHFHCLPSTVNSYIKRHGLAKQTPATIRKRRNTKLQTKIFNEVNVHVTTAQGMINELSVAISDNVAIKESIKQKIREAKRADVVKDEIDRFFEAQDRVVQRMKDYRELQRDLIGIAELQKFVHAIIEAYKTLPLEYRIRFQDELKKRDIVHLTVEQLVETSTDAGQERVLPGDDSNGDGKLSGAAETPSNVTPQQ
jgi:transcriptional regulator CtsR